MAINTYQIGDKPKITATFTDAAGAAIDPSVVTAYYKSPSGTTTTLVHGTDAALVKASPGVYTFYVLIDAAGLWQYRVVGSSSNQAAAQGRFQVEAINI